MGRGQKQRLVLVEQGLPGRPGRRGQREAVRLGHGIASDAGPCQRELAAAFRLRVAAAFFADAERSAAERLADAAPPFAPPFLLEACDSFLPRPPPDFLPPPDSLLTVAHARRFASPSDTPRS